jgi:hypothetical protein
MRRCARPLLLLAGLCVAAQAEFAFAQKPAPQKKPVYDQYEPSKVRRTRSQECMRDEDPVGAYCVKVCQKGYLPVPNIDPPRCRSIEPLPPGQIPGPIRKETGAQPKAPGSQDPRKPSGGQ